MIARCWLHIGTEKTGSTSIQTFLAENRSALLARGWLYSAAAGIRKHYNLAAYSLDDDRPDHARLGVPEGVSLDEFRQRLIASLEAETAASGAAVLVLSNELLATRLSRPAEIRRLKALCDRLARETKVIVYLRNQADFLASRYTNVIWEGGTHDFDFRIRVPVADHALLLDRWSDVFGKQNLVVRRFEPAAFPAGNVIADLADTIALDMRGLQMPARANPSLDAASLFFLRGINRGLPPVLAERIRPLRGAIVRALQRRQSGTRFTIPRAIADRIEDAYRDSNQRVATEYFGSRDRPLFSPPLLVSETNDPSRDHIGALMAMRIAGYLAFGLVRHSVFWAARRITRRRKQFRSR